MTRKNNKYPTSKKTNKPPYRTVTTPKIVKKKEVVGKIGYCDNATLGITDLSGKPIRGGHYVYIRELDGAGRCNVNVVTSLENKNGVYDLRKISKVKHGYLYPVPKNDAGFTQWSAINLDGNINGVAVSKIKNIGAVKMKRRHKFFVGKFTKRK